MVIFYAASIPRINTLVPLYKECKIRGIICKLVLSHAIEPSVLSDVKSSIDDQIEQLSRDAIAKLEGVSIFFTDESTVISIPKGAKRVSFWHSLPDKTFYPIFYEMIKAKPNIYLDSDFLFIPNFQHDDIFKAHLFDSHSGIFTKECFRSASDCLTIVPAGYPKLELLREKLPENFNGKKIVTYAPTRVGINGSSSENDAIAIIEALTSSTKIDEVVIRPYPLDYSFFKDLIERNSNRLDLSRIIFDFEPSSIEYQIRSSLVITDKSSYAITFALATCRPLIEVKLNADSCDAVEEIELGYRAISVDGLKAAVELGLEKMEYWQHRISNFTPFYINNPFTAVNYILDSLVAIESGMKRPDWITTFKTCAVSREEGIEKALQNLTKSQVQRVSSILDARA